MKAILKYAQYFTVAFALVGGGCSTTDVAESESDEEVGTSEQALTTFNWSGYTWTVKSGAGMGPGPNNWSDSSGSVWVDETDSLNLKVRKISGVWHCAEVYLTESLGYGTYEFFLKNQADDIDKWLVEGLFLYQDDTHELDVEWSLWGNGSSSTNAVFGSQPDEFHYFQGDIATGDWHKERIIWSSTGITYQFETNSVVEEEFTTNENNFSPGDERVHINNWLFQGHAPSNNQSSTMTLVSFTFTPE